MKKLFLALLTTFSLSGCWQTLHVQTKTVVVHVPEDMIAPCPLQEPPDLTGYAGMSFDEKEKLLSQAYVGSTSATIVCNVRLSKALELMRKQIKELESSSGKTDSVKPAT